MSMLHRYYLEADRFSKVINFPRKFLFISAHCAHSRTIARHSLRTWLVTLGQQAVERIVKTIAVYDDFCHANDPHEEHDFGSFEADGQMIFFKIDYYDKTLTYHSPDPSDGSVTERVITIMLADEY